MTSGPKSRRDVAAYLVTFGGWPVWLLGVWTVGQIMHARDVRARRPVIEEELRWEVDRRSGSRA